MKKYNDSDILNKRFGRLTALNIIKDPGKKHKIECLCECGVRKLIDKYALINGKIRSCGCLQSESARALNKKPILPGTRFGKWKVIEEDLKRNEEIGRTHYICECECGTIKTLSREILIKHKSSSCGCIRKRERESFVGKIIGNLRILSLSPNEPGKCFCHCACGNFCTAELKYIKAGLVKSCGCLAKNPVIILPNDKFGSLTVLKQIPKPVKNKFRGNKWYLCKCKCGAMVKASRNSLLSGHLKSCGCWRTNLSSFWELGICQKIEECLKGKAKCTYKTQKYIRDASGKMRFYDLLIEPFDSDRKIIIECNGIAFHPKAPVQNNPDGTEWKNVFTKESASEKYEKDMKKKELAEQNGYEVHYIWDDATDEFNINYILSII